jgi:hypothetical protein
MKTAGILLGSLISFAGALTHAQPSLTVKDYDNFYSLVILKAKNGSKAEWLASYESIVSFIARVRQDVETLPAAGQRALAKAVHDNGYWKGQALRVRDPKDPFIGAKFKAGDEKLKAVLTPQGYDTYRGRYAQGADGYRLALEAVANRVALYKLEGKNIPRLSEIPANTYIVNANAQSWDDLVADAQRYPDPEARMGVILRNQMNGIASALSLLRASQTRSDAEMDYATAVIWRYTGHYSGKDGWEREPLVRISYPQLSKAEKAKDRNVWKAVRDVLKAHPIQVKAGLLGNHLTLQRSLRTAQSGAFRAARQSVTYESGEQ